MYLFFSINTIDSQMLETGNTGCDAKDPIYNWNDWLLSMRNVLADHFNFLILSH